MVGRILIISATVFKFLAFILWTTVAILWFLAPNGSASTKSEVIIFHTNDMHARVSSADDYGSSIGLAEISAAVSATKFFHPSTLWLDAGDTLHGMPRINISNGENMVFLLNSSSLDALVPGNHDYNYGANQLIKLSKKLKPLVLSANTVKSGTSKNVFKPYKIYRLPNGIKVGVFGLSTPETAYKSNPKNTTGITFLDPVVQSKLMVSLLKSKCDLIVAVMHMGLDESSEFTSKRIAMESSGIDLIVDGHSHTTLSEGLKVNDTLIVQTGWHDYNLGQVTIQFEDHKIMDISARLLSSDDVKAISSVPDSKIQKTLKQIDQKNEKLFNEVIAHSTKHLSSNRLLVRRGEAELGNLCADAFRWKTGADIAIINGGGLRSDLPEGNVTRGDIMAIFPFGNTIQTAEVNGYTIRAMLEHSVFGYPASFGGFLDVSGLTFSFDPTQPADHRVSEIFVGDELLDNNKTYTLTANDFLFVGGDNYSMLNSPKIIGEYGTCEEILAEYLNVVGMPNIKIGRIKLLNEVELPDLDEEAA